MESNNFGKHIIKFIKFPSLVIHCVVEIGNIRAPFYLFLIENEQLNTILKKKKSYLIPADLTVPGIVCQLHVMSIC